MTLLIYASFLSLLGLAAIANGFVASILWRWFVVPLGAVPITIPWAIGLSVLVGMFKVVKSDDKKESADEKAQKFLFLFVNPLAALGIGWIAKQFM